MNCFIMIDLFSYNDTLFTLVGVFIVGHIIGIIKRYHNSYSTNLLNSHVAEVLCYGGGSGGGDGPPGSSGKGGRSAKEGIEEMNRAACRGAVYRSAGARSVVRGGTTSRAGWRWGPTYSMEVRLQSATVA